MVYNVNIYGKPLYSLEEAVSMYCYKYVITFEQWQGGDFLEYFGLLAFLLIIFNLSYPVRVRKLEKEVRRLKKSLKGENAMSKLINELKGYRCKISFNDTPSFVESDKEVYEVLDVDDEWVKLAFKDKKLLIKE